MKSGNNYLEQVNRRIGERDSFKSMLKREQKEFRSVRRDVRFIEKAQAFLQSAAALTQSELEYQISNLVTLALHSVFPNPYEFKVEFIPKRGKTEAELKFFRDGRLSNPISQSGGGTIDIAALALRLSFWSLPDKKSRSIFIMDEPMKNINDESRELHRKAADLLVELGDKLEVQFILVSQIPELIFHEKSNSVKL